MAELDLTGKVALITGAGSGIGKGAALVFAEHGAKVGVLDLKEDGPREVVEEIRSKGGEAEILTADVGNREQIKAAVDQLVAKYGRLDIVYANAGINGVWAPIDEITEEEYDRTMDTNLKGTFLTIQAGVPHLKKQGGCVLVTSSVQGTRMFSNAGATVYGTTKAGQVAMTKILAVELGNYKIRINAICPGAIETNIDQNTESRHQDQIKVPVEYPEGSAPLVGHEQGDIHQVGRLALFLASDMADHITGEVVYIDAGASLVVG